MNSASLPSDIEAQYEEYRSLSFSAIVALLFGFISVPTALAAHFNAGILIVPLIGMMVGIFAVLKLRRRADELTGMSAAKTGLILCTVVFFGGVVWGSYSYATEVPDGYERISFVELQPDPRYPQLPIPPSAMELHEKHVFVKGYVYPDGQSTNIKQFVLVPDMGTCCFGGQPKLTDMIQVTLRDPHRIEYSYYHRKLAGTLLVSPYKKVVESLDGVYYQLDAEYVK